MHIFVIKLAADGKTAEEWDYQTNQKKILIGEEQQGDKGRNQLVLPDTSLERNHLVIEDDGKNLFVTNLASREKTSLGDVHLSPLEQTIWLPEQELRLGDSVAPVILFHRATPLRKRNWYQLILRSMIWLLPLIAFIALASGLWWLLTNRTPVAISVATVTTPTPEITATITPTTVLPTNTPIPTLPSFVAQDGDAATAMAQQTADAIATLTPATATLTPTPEETTSAATPVWQPVNIDTQLHLKFIPASGRKGSEFWRLAQVIWLDEEAAGGRHLIYADARTELNQPAAEVHVSASWNDGSCERFMPQANQLHPFNGEVLDFDNYHIQCPMSAAGNIYRVRIVGAASDVIEGLGLGVPEFPALPIRTSFLLIFQRDKFK